MTPTARCIALLALAVVVGTAARARADWPAVPPPLPAPAGQVVHVSTEAALQQAVRALRSNTTIVIAPGRYQLTQTLVVNGPLHDVGIRGATGHRDDVVLLGRGVGDSSILHGIWVGGDVRHATVANLTVRDVFQHPLIFNPGPQAPHVYNVHLVNGGEQLLKTNPNPDGTGIDDGVVEYSLFEYEPVSKNWYANAIQVLAGRRWIIRHNLVRNIRAPAGEMAGPAVLAWFSAADTVVESNTFVNCQREIAFGLIDRTPNDHSGGIIRNNVIYRDAGLEGGDVSIAVFDSPGTRVLHNTVLAPASYPNAIEYRFAATAGTLIAHNLLSASIAARDGAPAATQIGNITTAGPALFVNASAIDLRPAPDAASVIDAATARDEVAVDWSGATRPIGLAPDIGALEFLPGAQAGTATRVRQQDLATAGAGSPFYRIPALTVTRAGTLLAAYDARPTLKDLPGRIRVVLRRSTDNGATWGPPVVVRDGSSSEGFGDPSLLVDGTTGRVFLFHAAGINQGFFTSKTGTSHDDPDVLQADYSWSDDDGLTWTYRRITSAIKDPAWGGIFAASGQGIQLRYGPHAGRLVQQYVVRHDNAVWAASAFSDDHGTTWRMGALVGPGADENKTVELSDGRLMLNSRAKPFRKIAVSSDGGATWTGWRDEPQLVDPANNGSIVRVHPDAPVGSAAARALLFSNTESRDRRQNLVIKRSCDDGATWSSRFVVESGGASYSTLARLPDGRFGLLYERGEVSAIVFAVLDLSVLGTCP